MNNFYIWIIFAIISIALLLVFWKKKNAVWGGLTTGIAIGLIIAIVFTFRDTGFNLGFIWRGAIIGTLIGFIAELLGKASDFIKKK